MKAYSEFYDETLSLMKSEDLKAFDLSQESTDTREKYGRNNFGQGCLLARRLVERGVRFIQLYHGAGRKWDSHSKMEEVLGLPT